MACFNDLPTEIRSIILYHVLKPLFPRYLELAPSGGAEVVSYIHTYRPVRHGRSPPAPFLVNRVSYQESIRLLLRQTPLALNEWSLLKPTTPIQGVQNMIVADAGLQIRTVDINLAVPTNIDEQSRETCPNPTTERLILDVIEHLPNVENVHLTAECLEYTLYSHPRSGGPLVRPDLDQCLAAFATSPLRDKVTRIRILLNARLLGSTVPSMSGLETSPIWSDFLANFLAFPNLREIELFNELWSGNRMSSSRNGVCLYPAAMQEFNRLRPYLNVMLAALPQVTSIGLWVSRRVGWNGRVGRKRLNQAEEKALLDILDEKTLLVHDGLCIVGADNVDPKRYSRIRRGKIFDAVPGCKWGSFRELQDSRGATSHKKRKRQ